MCIVVQTSAAFQFYCILPETEMRTVFQEIKVGCSSGVLPLLASEMKYKLHGRKTVVTNTRVLKEGCYFH